MLHPSGYERFNNRLEPTCRRVCAIPAVTAGGFLSGAIHLDRVVAALTQQLAATFFAMSNQVATFQALTFIGSRIWRFFGVTMRRAERDVLPPRVARLKPSRYDAGGEFGRLLNLARRRTSYSAQGIVTS